MPYAVNEGVEICYELEGSGPALILAHGLRMTGEDWRELGYVASLCQDFQLILVDARKHGKSSKPHDLTAYSPQARVNDNVAVMDDLGIASAHCWGHSSGGRPGVCSAKYAPERLHSLIIGGLDPYPRSRDIGDRSPPTDRLMKGLPDAENPIRMTQEQSGEAWLQFVESNISVPSGMKIRLKENDFQALFALLDNPYQYKVELESLYPASQSGVCCMPEMVKALIWG